MQRMTRIGFIVLALAAGFLAASPGRSETRVPSASFDHLKYDALLRKYVVNGRVRYRDWKKAPADREALDLYVASFATAPVARMQSNTKLAFYINAYNAITLKSILDAYPIKSIKDIPEVWDRNTWRVGGENVSLNDIEHKIIRPTWKDARVHFALVCAAKGCPPLINRAYNGLVIRQDLIEVTTKFIGDPKRTTIDYTKKILSLSRLFDWYKDDFIANEGSLPGFLAKYISDPAAQSDLRRGVWKVQHLDYDWALNETGKD
ncbi:MAG: DUF547 domain-containing protein [Candidatus Hydrogenedentota bacterium]